MLFFPGFLNATLQKGNPDLDFGYFTLGAEDPDDSQVAVTLNTLISVNAASKNLEAAKAFVDFIATPEQSALYAETAGTVSPTDAAAGTVPADMNPTMAQLFKDGRVKPQPNVDWPNSAVYNEALGQGVQGLFTGQKTVDQVLQDMDNAWG